MPQLAVLRFLSAMQAIDASSETYIWQQPRALAWWWRVGLASRRKRIAGHCYVACRGCRQMECESCMRLMGAWREDRTGVRDEERRASATASAPPIVHVEACCDQGHAERSRWEQAEVSLAFRESGRPVRPGFSHPRLCIKDADCLAVNWHHHPRCGHASLTRPAPLQASAKAHIIPPRRQSLVSRPRGIAPEACRRLCPTPIQPQTPPVADRRE